ncbi:MAG: hypothetical protein AB1656_21170 [Candidatus Omnitrophota bacterium]
MKLFGILFSFIIMLQGCATTLALHPQPSNDQKIIYLKGVSSLVSKKNNTVIVSTSESTHMSNIRPKFIIGVCNDTKEPFNFSIEDNITATVNGEAWKVYTYEELVEEVRRAQSAALIGAALFGMGRSMQASQAGYQYQSGSFNTSYYNTSGYSGYGYGSYSGYTYNPAAAAQAQAEANAITRDEINYITESTNQTLNYMGQNILQKNTVFPGMLYGGYVLICFTKIPKDINDIHICVTLLSEEHEFIYSESKWKK